MSTNTPTQRSLLNKDPLRVCVTVYLEIIFSLWRRGLKVHRSVPSDKNSSVHRLLYLLDNKVKLYYTGLRVYKIPVNVLYSNPRFPTLKYVRYINSLNIVIVSNFYISSNKNYQTKQ